MSTLSAGPLSPTAVPSEFDSFETINTHLEQSCDAQIACNGKLWRFHQRAFKHDLGPKPIRDVSARLKNDHNFEICSGGKQLTLYADVEFEPVIGYFLKSSYLLEILEEHMELKHCALLAALAKKHNFKDLACLAMEKLNQDLQHLENPFSVIEYIIATFEIVEKHDLTSCDKNKGLLHWILRHFHVLRGCEPFAEAMSSKLRALSFKVLVCMSEQAPEQEKMNGLVRDQSQENASIAQSAIDIPKAVVEREGTGNEDNDDDQHTPATHRTRQVKLEEEVDENFIPQKRRRPY